jgi:hypothetical protein
MSARQKKAACLALVLTLAFASSVITKPAHAAGGSRCTLDQQMWINGGGDGFGGLSVPGQTFVPSAPGRVCKIAVMISKNNPAAGDLLVTLRRHNFTPILNGTVTIPAAEIPMGLSVQTIDFCCNPPPVLDGSPFYGLTLASPNSVYPDYTWVNSDDAGADAAYPGGRGYGNAFGAAPGTPWLATGYDYAFRIYMCRP